MDIQEFLYLTQSRLDVDGPDPNQIITDIGILTPSRDRVNDCWANQQTNTASAKPQIRKAGTLRAYDNTDLPTPAAQLLIYSQAPSINQEALLTCIQRIPKTII